MFSFPLRRVRRNRHGGFELRLPDQERELVASVVGQLRTLLAAESEGEPGVPVDPTLRRLFPTAYAADADREAEYRELVHGDLRDRRLAAVDTVLATIGETRLDEEQLLAWMGAVNDVRLVLGTRLDVSEETPLDPDPGDPDGPALAVYGYLGFLLESIVDALAR